MKHPTGREMIHPIKYYISGFFLCINIVFNIGFVKMEVVLPTLYTDA